MPVLWVESIGTRRPHLARRGDLLRAFRRLKAMYRRAETKENHLRVLSPLLIPRAETGIERRLNRTIFGRLAARELKSMGSGPVEYWCFVPNAVDLLPTGAGHRSGDHPASGIRHPASGTRHPASQRSDSTPLVIYYCADDWTKFKTLDETWMSAKEDDLFKRADLVFAVSEHLVDRCRSAMQKLGLDAGNVHYAPHGVEHSKFASALSEPTPVPEDIARIPRPVAGFYGNIYPWVDFDLLGALARRRPDWNFVLIGEVFCDVGDLAALPNVHFPGRKEHDDLPACCKSFDAGMIPYDTSNPRMESVSPVKTRELLAAGVPLVASDVPELRRFGRDVLISRTPDEWIEALETQMARTDRRAISESVAQDDWSMRVKVLREIIEARAGASPAQLA